jgi:hypothetical protein
MLDSRSDAAMIAFRSWRFASAFSVCRMTIRDRPHRKAHYFAADRVTAWAAKASVATHRMLPRKGLVRDFTSRLRGNVYLLRILRERPVMPSIVRFTCIRPDPDAGQCRQVNPGTGWRQPGRHTLPDRQPGGLTVVPRLDVWRRAGDPERGGNVSTLAVGCRQAIPVMSRYPKNRRVRRVQVADGRQLRCAATSVAGPARRRWQPGRR